MKLKYLNEEQVHQMSIHKWIRSEEVGHDIGECGNLDWARNYAAIFRDWAENLPLNCIQCGLTGCQGPDDDSECSHPFCNERLNLLQKSFPTLPQNDRKSS
jgi:hypothetical protein